MLVTHRSCRQVLPGLMGKILGREEEVEELVNELLRVTPAAVEEFNNFLSARDNEVVRELLRVVNKYGTPQEINAKAEAARQLPNLMNRLRNMNSPYLARLQWLIEERDKGSFVPISQYRR